jgi:hypothetical protein
MKNLFLILLGLSFTGCISLINKPRLLTGGDVKHGQLYLDGNPVNILGNPHVTCYQNGEVVADGIFVGYDEADNAIIIDEYGKGYLVVLNPSCRLWDNN